jgi:hypothetical protein
LVAAGVYLFTPTPAGNPNEGAFLRRLNESARLTSNIQAGFQRQIEGQFNRNIRDGLANAVRKEVRTGELTGGKSHIEKAQGAIRWAERQANAVRRNDSLTPSDKAKLVNRLESFSSRLRNALKEQ